MCTATSVYDEGQRQASDTDSLRTASIADQIQLERLRNSLVIRSLNDATQQLARIEPVAGTSRYQLVLTTFMDDYAGMLRAAQSVVEAASSEDEITAAYTSFATDFPLLVSTMRQERAQLPAAARQALATVEGCGSLVSL